jgi:peptidoglycan hydrolase-like protein with peptidoglycan-binding domain
MMPTIRLGSLGEPVRTLQSALNLWTGSNQSRLDVDGFFGLRTNSKVREYQSAHELARDGVVGPLTWEALTPLVEQALGSTSPAASDPEPASPIVLAYSRTGAAPAPSPSRPPRAWTASPAGRRDATRRSARRA